MKILYVPLDERPCNYKYPSLNVAGVKNISLIVPPKKLLGQKKKAAELTSLWNFVEAEIDSCDYAVLSLDMLLYGGLIPSRIHGNQQEIVDSCFDKISHLKEKNPNLKIFASQCIMRSPRYNSSDEEPDYYETYGKDLHRRAFLADKEKRETLSTKEKEEQEAIQIPNEVVADYETRRNFNLNYNMKALALIKEQKIDFLVIPQDDSAEFGYTAKDQNKVRQAMEELNVEKKVRIYPGADEVGQTLVTRAYLDYKGCSPKIYTFYSSTLGPQIIPDFEDRPLRESLKSHIEACGLTWTDNSQEARYILAYNTPGKVMVSASQQNKSDATYHTYRNLLTFTLEIQEYLKEEKYVGICDSAYSNGGDLKLLKYLKMYDLLEDIYAYAGWNTNCNSLGTALSALVLRLFPLLFLMLKKKMKILICN